MNEDPSLSELWRIKEEIGNRYGSARELAEAVNRLAKTDPLPPAGKSRKMIEGFPKGQSVGDEDEIMRELRAVKERIAAENGYDVRKIAEAARTFSSEHPAQRPRKSQKKLEKELQAKIHASSVLPFRGTSSKSAGKQRGHDEH